MDAPFGSNSVYVALALGSINFGTSVYVASALAKVVEWVKSGGFIYMRGNPGEEVHPGIEIFAWFETKVKTMASDLGLTVRKQVQMETIEDASGKKISRLFLVYRKGQVDHG